MEYWIKIYNTNEDWNAQARGELHCVQNKAQNSGMLGWMMCKRPKLNRFTWHIPNAWHDELVTDYDQKKQRETIMKLTFQF